MGQSGGTADKPAGKAQAGGKGEGEEKKAEEKKEVNKV